MALLGIKAHTDKAFLGHFVPPEKAESTKNEKLSDAYVPMKTATLSSTDEPQLMQLRGGHGHGDRPEDTTISPPILEEGETPTLEEYLSKLTCNGCGKHCPLTVPQCGKGKIQAKNAECEYVSLYESNAEIVVPEIVFEDENDDFERLFTTMLPVRSLYICGTNYAVKFTKRKKK